MCGAAIAAPDRSGLEPALLDHFNTAHPQLRITAMAVTNYLDAVDRLAGQPTERVQRVERIEAFPVTDERINDVLTFFDGPAFADNPAWAVCYCMELHRDDPAANSSNPWRENRADIASRLRDGSTLGYLAYADGNPAGWCNASLRRSYPGYRTGDGDDAVGVIACFVIAPTYRKHGVARRLLDAALAGFAERGVRRVEAHPNIAPVNDASQFHGPIELYLQAGFEEVSRGERTALVVKQLPPPGQ